jgi:hypothetical protein
MKRADVLDGLRTKMNERRRAKQRDADDRAWFPLNASTDDWEDEEPPRPK